MQRITFIYLWLIIVGIGCTKTDNINRPGEFIDYGTQSSMTLRSTVNMFYYKSEIFIGSDNGIWKVNLGDKVWRPAGLEGKKITCLYNHPALDGFFYAGVESSSSTVKSFYISTDKGLTWSPAESPVFDATNNRYETYYDLKARPGHPAQLFANLNGTTIAVSKDGGQTWNRRNYAASSDFNYPAQINFLDNDSQTIYQGAEAPLDIAWFAKYRIDPDDPVKIDQFQRLIGTDLEWGNRRPNCVKVFRSNPSVFYIGQEGALSKVQGSSWRYLFKSEQTNATLPYSYIYGVWINPGNSKHIIFGGGINGENETLSFYESRDEGKTIIQVSNKLGMIDPEIVDIVATDQYPAVLVRDRGSQNKLRLFLYKYH